MPGARRSSDQRLSLIVETGRDIAAAGDELQSVIQLIAKRAQEITGACGAMVNLIEKTMLHTRAVTGIAVKAFDARRPIAGSIARVPLTMTLTVPCTARSAGSMTAVSRLCPAAPAGPDVGAATIQLNAAASATRALVDRRRVSVKAIGEPSVCVSLLRVV